MYRENRIPTQDGFFENSSQGWANYIPNAASLSSATLSALKTAKMRRSPEYALIKKYVQGPVLDVGCGPGEWVEFLRNEGYSVQGMDYCAPIIEQHKRLLPHSQWTVGSFRDIPFPDASFNGAISLGAIQHDPEGPAAAMREMFRILRPGGSCLVTVPIDSKRQREVSLTDNPGNRGNFHQFYFTREDVAGEMAKAGFEVLHCDLRPVVSIGLAAPKLFRRTIGTRFFILARLAALFASVAECANMVACVGRRPEA